MKLEHLKAYLKDNIDYGDGISLGCINANLDKCIGIYPARQDGLQRICLGGSEATQSETTKCTILIHWGTSYTSAETQANDIHRLFFGQSDFMMDGIQVYCTDPSAAPVPVGRDESGIYEFIINLTIIHKKE